MSFLAPLAEVAAGGAEAGAAEGAAGVGRATQFAQGWGATRRPKQQATAEAPSPSTGELSSVVNQVMKRH